MRLNEKFPSGSTWVRTKLPFSLRSVQNRLAVDAVGSPSKSTRPISAPMGLGRSVTSMSDVPASISWPTFQLDAPDPELEVAMISYDPAGTFADWNVPSWATVPCRNETY